MTKVLTGAVAALLLTVSAMSATAGMTCTRVGNSTFCTDDQGNRTTCTRVGNNTFCN